MSSFETPDILDESSIEFSESADVLVIGVGTAGLSAAISASNNNLKVIALDRASGTA
jgi:ribulose 1,5-bisphosphate synthetase/thiazole synthase